MRLVMTLKVRDEDDVLEHNLRYHLAQGVDFFVVTDNGSRDGTLDILRSYERDGVLHLIEEPADEFRKRGRQWVTRMARMAATDFGAEWVIHNDADEFWWPVAGGTLKAAFASIPDAYSVLYVPRPEFVARPDGPGAFHERLVVREALSRLRPKTAHRARRDVRIGRGSHYVSTIAEAQGFAVQHSSRAVLRAVSPEIDRTASPDVAFDHRTLVPAPRWPVRSLHFPIRSFEQYRRRLEITLYGGSYGDDPRRRRLREAAEEGRLREVFDSLVLDDEAVRRGVADGTLVVDERLSDFMARCPERPTGETGPLELSEESIEADLAANAYDVMQALDRTERSMRRRRRRANARRQSRREEQRALRERVDDLERERDRLARRLVAIESSRWWRAGAMAGRLLGRGRG